MFKLVYDITKNFRCNKFNNPISLSLLWGDLSSKDTLLFLLRCFGCSILDSFSEGLIQDGSFPGILSLHSSYTLVVTSTNMDASLQGWVAFVLFESPKVHVCCSSPICSSLSRAHVFLLSDFCSCIILSSKDDPYSLRQHGCLVLKTFVLPLSLLQRML